VTDPIDPILERLDELEALYRRSHQEMAIACAKWEVATQAVDRDPTKAAVLAVIPIMRETSDAALAFGSSLRRFVDYAQPIMEMAPEDDDDDAYEPDDEEEPNKGK
jgi:hypothetical protein